MGTSERPEDVIAAARKRIGQNPRSARFGRIGSVLLSVDFLMAVPAGIIAGLATINDNVEKQAPTILLAVAAILASLAGIVVASHTIMITLMDRTYLEILRLAEGGIRAVSQPYRVVIFTCAGGAVCSLLSALLALSDWNSMRPVVAISFGLSTGCGIYGLVGTAQLTGLSAFHLEQRANLLKIMENFDRAKATTNDPKVPDDDAEEE